MSKAKATDADIKKIETKIALYDRSIKRAPDDPKSSNSYYMKAGALTEIGKLKGDSTTFEQALECYIKAIKLDSENAIYYADRSKLYVEIGRVEEAVADIAMVNKLPNADALTNIYLSNTCKDISRLEAVANTIRKLKESGKLDPELATALAEHAKVTEGLVVQVGIHGEKLDNHEAKIKKLETMLEQALAGQKVTKQQVKDLGVQVKKHDEAIIKISTDIVANKKEFNKFKSEATHKFKGFDKKIELVETEVEGQKKLVAHIEDSLYAANVFSEVEIKERFNGLKETYGENVYEYANKFYLTLNNYLLAHKMLSTGMIDGQAYEGRSSVIEGVAGVLGSVLGQIFESVPLAGDVIGIINTIIVGGSKAYDKAKSDQIVKKVNDSISGMLDKDLNLTIAEAAVGVASVRSEAINKQDASQENTTKLTKAREYLEQKLDKTLHKITKVKETYDTKESKMALKDVILLISYITKSDEKLIKDQDKPTDAGQRIAHMFDEGGAITQQLEQMQPKASKWGKLGKKEDYKAIKANYVTDLVYDNPLLNDLELLQKAAEEFGINKAITLGAKLNPGLITYAEGNYEIVAAGLLSLEQSDQV